MSRHASRFPSRLWSAGYGFLACLAASPVPAQTIADYSRAQRALLENAMTQAAARSAGVSAAASAPTPVTPASSVSGTPPPRVAQALLPPAPPAVQVSGVFASNGGALAEVVVNATPYLLASGDGVPGTTWQVESVAIDRVVLGRHPGTSTSFDAAAGRKVFPLPARR